MSSGLSRTWDRITIYLPVILMGLLAMGTYWLARNTPTFALPSAERPATHDPDYFLRGFSVKTFDAGGRLKSEIHGAEARHFPDTDTLEIDQPRIRSYNQAGALTVATARKAISNGDGSQVQLIGNAVVTRETGGGATAAQPKLEIHGEFLHAFLAVEKVTSNKPVRILRGGTRFDADQLEYDNLDRVLELRGNVRGVLPARSAGG